MLDGFVDERVGSASADTEQREVIYVDGTVMMPTLRKATAEPAGIARAGLHIVSSFQLDPTIRSRILVADRGSRRLLSLLPEDRSSEHDLMRSMTELARSLQRSRVQRAVAGARDSVLGWAGRPWQLPPDWTRPGARGVFLHHGNNIHPGFCTALQHARRRHGIKLAQHLHDVLPLTHAETPARAREFDRFLRRYIATCDFLLTSSHASAAALREALARISDRPPPPVTVVQLAHEYAPWQSGTRRPELPGLADHDFVLSVGSITERKNQLGLLRAWQRYRSGSHRRSDAHLVLAGSFGKGSREVVALLERENHFDRTVHVLAAPDDRELTWLYENCLFTAYVSLAEGWGLPIGESLWVGKTCLASRTTAMLEAGADQVVFVDPSSVEEIAAQLGRLLDEEGLAQRLGEQIDRSRLRTWRDFRRELVDAVRSHTETDPRA
jgi:glycosyltransferase involved in cell wall biosynthesis